MRGHPVFNELLAAIFWIRPWRIRRPRNLLIGGVPLDSWGVFNTKGSDEDFVSHVSTYGALLHGGKSAVDWASEQTASNRTQRFF
jgi:hypothetical protein